MLSRLNPWKGKLISQVGYTSLVKSILTHSYLCSSWWLLRWTRFSSKLMCGMYGMQRHCQRMEMQSQLE
jgi:hypothetical protein